MITEAYVSFEVAKLLKEKGFDEECYTFYEYDSGDFYREERNPCCNSYSDDYTAPTLQTAMKWLRVTYKHHIVAEPRLYNSANTDSDFSRWFWTIITEDSYLYSEGEDFPTYESAAEAALKHCLENLI